MSVSNEEDANSAQAGTSRQLPYTIRLPGFIGDEEVGLGDVVKRATSSFGIRSCGSCEQRAAALNRWLVFTGLDTK
jgi:hypothetical protein